VESSSAVLYVRSASHWSVTSARNDCDSCTAAAICQSPAMVTHTLQYKDGPCVSLQNRSKRAYARDRPKDTVSLEYPLLSSCLVLLNPTTIQLFQSFVLALASLSQSLILHTIPAMLKRQENTSSSIHVAPLTYSTQTLQYATTPSVVNLMTWNLTQSTYQPVAGVVFELPKDGGIPSLNQVELPVISAANFKPASASGFLIAYTASPAAILYQWDPDQTAPPSLAPSTKSSGEDLTIGSVVPSTITGSATPTSLVGKKPSLSGGVSSGATAGIAVGCFLAGVLLTGLIFWFCWRKRKPPRTHDFEASRTALVAKEKGFATHATPLDGSPMSDLPLPLEDKAISGEVSKIASSIKNHIQSYYHADRVNAAFLDLDDIQAISGSLPVSVETLSTLLSNATTREIALIFCVAWVVCSRVLPGVDSKATLLPLEIAGCYKKIAKAQKASSSKYKHVVLSYFD
jgi:hypothetical protein